MIPVIINRSFFISETPANVKLLRRQIGSFLTIYRVSLKLTLMSLILCKKQFFLFFLSTLSF